MEKILVAPGVTNRFREYTNITIHSVDVESKQIKIGAFMFESLEAMKEKAEKFTGFGPVEVTISAISELRCILTFTAPTNCEFILEVENAS